MKTFEFKNKKIHFLEKSFSGQQWIYVNGRTLCLDLKSKGSKSRKSSSAAAGNQLHAPMPGKVTKLLVTNGAQVKKGDSVVVMEAMKMEYTLKAEMNGQVQAIHASVGQQVTLGQLLVELNEDKK
jgi:biotin carboxyl carrier protein